MEAYCNGVSQTLSDLQIVQSRIKDFEAPEESNIQSVIRTKQFLNSLNDIQFDEKLFEFPFYYDLEETFESISNKVNSLGEVKQIGLSELKEDLNFDPCKTGSRLNVSQNGKTLTNTQTG